MFFRVINCIPYLIDIGFFNKSTRGTTVHTLPTVSTHNMTHRLIVEGRYFLMSTLIGNCNCGYRLKLRTGSDTTLTPDTFTVVLDKRRGRSVNIIVMIFNQIEKDMVANANSLASV